jgi:hypothetical protein
MSGATPLSSTRDSHRGRSLSNVAFNLDEAIASVMQERMHSLSTLRDKIEELADIQQKEADQFVESMRGVFEQSKVTRESLSETEAELTTALAKEREERQRAVAIVTRFKSEGAVVMTKLKANLRDLQGRHQQTLEENKRLRAELAKWRDKSFSNHTTAAAPIAPAVVVSSSTHHHRSSSPAVPRSVDPHAAAQQIAALASLLEEQDHIVNELQERRRVLERQVVELTRERDRYLNMEPQEVPKTLLDEFRRSESFEGPLMPDARVRQLAQALLRRLKAEQIQRLRVEEQAAKITAAQDQGLRRLEKRVRELESGPSQSASSVVGGGHPASRGPQSPVIPTMNRHVASSSTPATALQHPQHGNAATPGASSSSGIAPPHPLQLPRLTAVQLMHQTSTSADSTNHHAHHYVANGVAPSGLPTRSASSGSQSLAAPPHPPPQQHPDDDGSVVRGRASSIAHLPTLEEQLQAVTAEFQASLAQWQQIVATESDLLPESPARPGTVAL